MQTVTEPLLREDAVRLREAIRRHRRRVRPSSRSQADLELYRALSPDEPRPTVHQAPPEDYLRRAESYYDSPY